MLPTAQHFRKIDLQQDFIPSECVNEFKINTLDNKWSVNVGDDSGCVSNTALSALHESIQPILVAP